MIPETRNFCFCDYLTFDADVKTIDIADKGEYMGNPVNDFKNTYIPLQEALKIILSMIDVNQEQDVKIKRALATLKIYRDSKSYIEQSWD